MPRTSAKADSILMIEDRKSQKLMAPSFYDIYLNFRILSACDTAVGPIEGEEGIAALSSAFLLAGARSVVSTLWSIDDTFSLFLMKQFYKHLAARETVAAALTAAPQRGCTN